MADDTIPAHPDIAISNTQGHLKIDPEALRGLAGRVLLGEGVRQAEISIVLVDDQTIHALNDRHLGHNWPTDVITFPLSEPDDTTLAAELVVSAEMAVVTARQAGTDPCAELALYVVHGLLHLCGYDDQTPEDRIRIRRREDEILTSEGLTNTFSLVGPPEVTETERESVRWAV
ncbi:rRNA maturation RNase YbeY [Singulisphaera sp. Ch08]|uniref:Endoribonuclease YbeY n=1 Tax=Singulisphaera sp. Ch08 TaxID=3120278 RepID=A0AAU7C6G9_9BACT